MYDFVWFDSLHPTNNLSVKQGRVFLGWTSTKLGLMCLAQGPQRSDPSEAQTCGPSVSSQALYHWATALPPMYEGIFSNIAHQIQIHQKENKIQALGEPVTNLACKLRR